jgi:SagB-type dehydrogenase family enzyme
MTLQEKRETLLIRPSRYLSLRLHENQCIAQNLLVGQERILPVALIPLLLSMHSYISRDEMSLRLEKLFPATTMATDAIVELVKAGLMVEEQSELSTAEEKFSEWPWSREAASHFLSTRRIKWMNESNEVEVFGKLLQAGKIPKLWSDISDREESWQPLGVHVNARDTFNSLGKRRSLRQFSNAPISSDVLGAIFNAGLGIQKFLDLPFRPTYPLGFSPSPGGLNVFTGYIFVKNVSGLTSGTYQYNALRNQVLKLAELPNCPLSQLFGNQRWADEAAVVCMLVADYEKMSWKYSDQSAFNSLLIESGHIAQNMMVCAASLSVGSVPTNAISQAELEQYLSLAFPKKVILYALAFGHEDTAREKDHYSTSSLLRLKEILEER